ncbi:MAG: class I SAM-dependent methyltransferase [Acidobacteria bacterium]|nr:class I SAM-dependent methyltransferase [Acidobacteriota bacterium]
MPTDLGAIIANLHAFYDFTRKSVISVGAGGGQLVHAWAPAREVVAIDADERALQSLEQALAAKPFRDRVRLVRADFLRTAFHADVVLFEFCLHEMSDPGAAIHHARCCAPDVVVLDHAEDSDWAYFVAEEEKVRASSAAMRAAGIRQWRQHDGVQRWAGYPELRAKVAGQGQVAIDRIEEFRDSGEILIPMGYVLALL